jgi:hypothetical protein
MPRNTFSRLGRTVTNEHRTALLLKQSHLIFIAIKEDY